MNEDGTCVPETIDKHRLASRLRVPMRDLRMLEPNHSNSYSAAILSRERCMVVHLEQVRLLITAEEVYVQDGRNPAVTRYLPEPSEGSSRGSSASSTPTASPRRRKPTTKRRSRIEAETETKTEAKPTSAPPTSAPTTSTPTASPEPPRTSSSTRRRATRTSR